MKQLITVISHPRSGSSFFIREAGTLDNLCPKMEVFHPNEAVIDQHLGALSYRVKQSLGCPETGFREYLLADPVHYLSMIQDEVEEKALIFKVFPTHLPLDKMQTVLEHSDLTIVLLRNVLHSYISSEIAKKVGRYGGVDTTDIKIAFSESAFLWKVRFITGHFEDALNIVDRLGRVPLFVNYETFQAKDGRTQWLSRKLSRRLGDKFAVSTAGNDMKKQDGRVSALDKVSNPEEMASFLKKNRLSYLNDERVPSNYNDLRRLAPEVCKAYGHGIRLRQKIARII